MNRPDWKDAPEWAMWLSCDPSGNWFWHDNKPKLAWSATSAFMYAGNYTPPEPAKMLEERPL